MWADIPLFALSCPMTETLISIMSMNGMIMKMKLYAFVVLMFFLLLTVGCKEPFDLSEPNAAFRSIAPCVDRRDAKCLFHRLDRESQRAIHSIFKTLVQMRQIVDRSYPEKAKSAAFGVWERESRAVSPEELFEIFCEKNNCMRWITDGFGAVSDLKAIDTNRMEISTKRGGVFNIRLIEQEWGLDRFYDELKEAEPRLFDRLREARKNAAVYEEQKLVNGE